LLTDARKAAKSLLKILNDILDLSKIEAGRLELSPIPFSLRECIREAIATLGITAGQKGLGLAADVSRELPDKVIGDPFRLRQILLNLLNNAIKFTSSGTIGLGSSVREFRENRVGVHFSVSDTGAGIPPEKISSIFGAFRQADWSTSREYGGTGLGSTISSQLVGLMGGQIWVESTVGVGSTFHFTAEFELNPGSGRALQPDFQLTAR
jgi:signal transduction histidine kinase